MEATNKKLLENHHSASLPPQSLVVFAFKKYMKIKIIEKELQEMYVDFEKRINFELSKLPQHKIKSVKFYEQKVDIYIFNKIVIIYF